MAAATLLSAEEARGYLASPPTGGALDPKLEALIASVEMAYARMCGYPGARPTLASRDYVRHCDGRGGRDLLVDVAPLTAISEIRDDPSRDFTDDTLVVDADDYHIVSDDTEDIVGHGVVRLYDTSTHGTWSTGRGVVRVACTAGFLADQVPDDLKALIGAGVRHLYDQPTTQGKVSVTAVGVTTTYVIPTAFFPTWIRGALGQFTLIGAIT